MHTLKSVDLAAFMIAVKVPITVPHCFPIDCEFQRFGGKRIFGYFMLMTAIACRGQTGGWLSTVTIATSCSHSNHEGEQ